MVSVPNATYRLQLTESFTLNDAAALVPYLQRLGISHVYLSPILRARSGSTHGYDVVDPNQIDPRLGGEEGWAQLRAALTEAGMGAILDFVPNHMGIGKADNDWWLDVLEWGMASPYARFFDIDWHRPEGRARPVLVLPILGKPYGEALRDGEIQLKFDRERGSFSFWYFEHRLPVRVKDYLTILRLLPASVQSARTLVEQYEKAGTGRDAGQRLKAAMAGCAELGDVLTAELKKWNDKKQRSDLHRLLLRQHYRPTFWRSGTAAINYRRFFDINDLAGLRIEDAGVFDAVHKRIFELLGGGGIQGIRLDHVDGLQDPIAYCRELGERSARIAPAPYILIEKILGEHESLPDFPHVAGTTGYEWMNVLSQVLLQGAGMPRLEQTWRHFTGERRPIDEIIAKAKAETLTNLFDAEFTTLIRLLHRIVLARPDGQDFSAEQLSAALRAYIIALPVYRTYMSLTREPSAQDRAIIENAIVETGYQLPGIDSLLLDFLKDLLSLDLVRRPKSGYSRRRAASFVARLQQLSGPVMAKAMEDTSFYRIPRLLALNEVGGHPGAPAMELADFHVAYRRRIAQQPYGLTATATHDTKRGEDARMRLVALSELADEWSELVAQWKHCNAGLIETIGGKPAPSPVHEYLLYQALLGGWPVDGAHEDFPERFSAYAVKAARESKLETSWRDLNGPYEETLVRFAKALASGDPASEFTKSFKPFAERVALLGALNSLSQLALKILLPGVPDIYQGTEYWDLSFVDPDNRCPVDYAARQRQQAELMSPGQLVQHWQDGKIKFALLQHLLRLRAANPEPFREGDMQLLQVTGTYADSVVAVARRHKDTCVVIVAGRHMSALTDQGRHWPDAAAWGDAAVVLPDGQFRDLLGGKSCKTGKAVLSELMWPWSVAVLGNDGFRTVE